MKKTQSAIVLIAGLTALTTQAQVDLKLYNGFSDTGTGIAFSNLAGESSVANVLFGNSQANFDWFPLGGGVGFGADFTGSLNVPSTGAYLFSLTSDDGSYLFIDGTLVVSNGSDHGPAEKHASPTLTAGIHTFEVQFYENGAGASGVDLVLPEGVTFTTAATNGVPDAGATWGMVAMAAAGILRFARKPR